MELDEFVTLDFIKIFNNMTKPAFLFDGRKILDHERLIRYDNIKGGIKTDDGATYQFI